MSRLPRARAIDTQQFDSTVEEALMAYASDFNFAIKMAAAASAIQAKRTVWSLRLELREAEEKAQAKCAEASKESDFCCVLKTPCGTGACPFAEAGMVLLDVPLVPGKSVRPVPARHQEYSLEPAVHTLRELRSA